MNTPENTAVIEVNKDKAAGTQYTVMVASKAGHEEKTLGLDDTIDYLFDLFKNKRMWINVDDTLFHPEAAFNGGAADNKLVERDRTRLRNLILENTKEIEGQETTVPMIAAVGQLRGGAFPLTAKLYRNIQLVKQAKGSVSNYLATLGIPARDIPIIMKRHVLKTRQLNQSNY